ncbi:hypothetical protein SLS62_008814 [Diatrype stigma]|uniref:Uncharacterized protein n=1 Tax=Diatrype stigma TaxID=117547 RepID=A0AAN9YMP8_9PEZI
MVDFDTAKGQLVDIREKGADESAQNYALTRQYPIEYWEQALDAHGLDRDEFKREEYSSLDAAICVLRHITAHVAVQRREGISHPLEPMVWADLAVSSGAAQTCVRYHMLKQCRQLLDANANADASGSASASASAGASASATATLLSYQTLLENQSMYETLWASGAFMLWHKAAFQRTPNSNWERVELADPPKLAKMGCIHYDGVKGMGHRISSQYGPNPREGTLTHWQSNTPAIIRVLYDNTTSTSVSRTYEHLTRVTVDGQRVRPGHDNQGQPSLVLTPDEPDLMDYQLIAAVRLRDASDTRDRIRLYRVDGEPLRLHGSLTPRFSGTEWRLGEKARFMLYYTPALRKAIDAPPPREVAEPISMSVRDSVREMRAFAQGPAVGEEPDIPEEPVDTKEYESFRSYLERTGQLRDGST